MLLLHIYGRAYKNWCLWTRIVFAFLSLPSRVGRLGPLKRARYVEFASRGFTAGSRIWRGGRFVRSCYLALYQGLIELNRHRALLQRFHACIDVPAISVYGLLSIKFRRVLVGFASCQTRSDRFRHRQRLDMGGYVIAIQCCRVQVWYQRSLVVWRRCNGPGLALCNGASVAVNST